MSECLSTCPFGPVHMCSQLWCSENSKNSMEVYYSIISNKSINIGILSVMCVVCVMCVHIWFVSCPRSGSLLVDYVPAVFYYVSDYSVYLSSCLFS